MTTSVFVFIKPTAATDIPVFGMVRPRNAGLFRTLSGVSPAGTCHKNSPRSRLIAVSVPYGGFMIGSP
jgi:hypothetical protein